MGRSDDLLRPLVRRCHRGRRSTNSNINVRTGLRLAGAEKRTQLLKVEAPALRVNRNERKSPADMASRRLQRNLRIDLGPQQCSMYGSILSPPATAGNMRRLHRSLYEYTTDMTFFAVHSL